MANAPAERGKPFMVVYPPPPGPQHRLQSRSSVGQINPARNDKFRVWPAICAKLAPFMRVDVAARHFSGIVQGCPNGPRNQRLRPEAEPVKSWGSAQRRQT